MIAATKSVWRQVKWAPSAGLIALLFCVGNAVAAADIHPLRPPDASSPRATLQSFIETTDDVYRRATEVLETYGRSDRLYPNAEEHHKMSAALQEALNLQQFFDLSAIAPVLRETVAGERILQLKEVLDRIDLPAMAEIPDREAMTRMRRSDGGCQTPKSTSFGSRTGRTRANFWYPPIPLIAFPSTTRGSRICPTEPVPPRNCSKRIAPSALAAPPQSTMPT
jgi:hypothetical protein